MRCGSTTLQTAVIFKGVERMAELCALTDELIREAFGISDPVRTQVELDREDYVARGWRAPEALP
jgi:hypothetical protein